MSNIKKKKKASIDPNKNILSMEDTYESNLPTPEDLEKYNKIIPGGAERIFTMAEKEQNFRHKIIPKAINKLFIISIIGLITSFCIILSLLFFSYLLIEKGEDIKGIGLLIGTIGIIGASFILKIKGFNDNNSDTKKLKEPKKKK